MRFAPSLIGLVVSTATAHAQLLFPGTVVPLAQETLFRFGQAIDIDQDGDADWAIMRGGLLTVCLNHGDGQFTVLPDVNVGGDAAPPVFADLNADGVLDCIGTIAQQVTITEGTGQGTFAGAQFEVELSAQSSDNVVAAAALDLDGDGDLDLVATLKTNGPDYAYVILNQSPGGAFTPGDFVLAGQTGVGPAPNRFATGDLDADGDDDLVLTHTSGVVRVLINDGDGTISSGTQIVLEGMQARDVELADLDNDGDLDAAVVTGDALAILSNNGAGAMTLYALLPAGQQCSSIAHTDINQDGYVDLALGRGWGLPYGPAGVFYGEAGLGFSPLLDLFVSTESVDLADFDGDGLIDLGYNDRNIFGMLFQVDGDGFTGAPRQYGSFSHQAIALGDFDSDGDLDVLAFGPTSELLMNDGDGNLQSVSTPDLDGSHRLALADFDDDGNLDALTREYFAGAAWLSYGNGDGTFQAPALIPGDPSQDLEVGDLNADGLPDFAATQKDGDQVFIYLNDGTPASFTHCCSIAVGPDPWDLVIADLDGDGENDVVTANSGISGSADTVQVILNLGAGSFAPAVPYTAIGAPRYLAVEDMDADGDQDIIAAGPGDSVALLFNNSDGTFAPPSIFSAGDFIQNDGIGFVVGDMDGDARPDVIFNNAKGYATVLKNLGGQLTPDLIAPFDMRADAVTDLDGDGELDVLSEGLFVLRTSPDPVSPPPAPPTGPDLNADGSVNSADLNLVLAGFGCTAAPGFCIGDTDLDGDTDTVDLNAVLAAFGS